EDHEDFNDAFQFLTSAPEHVERLAVKEIKDLSELDEDCTPEAQIAANRLANTAMLLFRLGQPEFVWPLLKNKPHPQACTLIVNGLADRKGRPQPLVSRLQAEQNPGIQQALLLCLGTFPRDSVEPDPVAREQFIGHVLSIYENHKNGGVHSAARWLLQQWDKRNELKQIDEQLQTQPKSGGAEWFVNGQSQTFVALGPGEFLMGSPNTESKLLPEEKQHSRTIKHRFALCTTEVTRQQWERFARSKDSSNGGDFPIQGVNWQQAVQYCNWLSEQEGISKDQWCYKPNAEGEYSEGTQVKEGFRQLAGYRLPTEGEWEYACRAGTETRFHFGDSELLLEKYARFEADSSSRVSTAPIASFQPNPWGLFDMHGNVMEWCTDAYEEEDITLEKGQQIDPSEVFLRVLRGGGFSATPPNCRAAKRWKLPASLKNQSVGFRVCVTISTPESHGIRLVNQLDW
ncbi:MAG: formylglycine-generating enzyme family protein, partial [Fuerstiella sp.]|nr:formylglycine-generating enzyme family protein [Fuerstiella sp.]